MQEAFPLAFTQQNVLTFASMRGEDIALAPTVRVDRRLSERDVLHALGLVLRRQTALAYKLERAPGGVRQSGTSASEARVPIEFLAIDEPVPDKPHGGLDGAQSPAARRVVAALGKAPLDPFRGQMIRAGAIAWQDATELYFRVNHVVFDGWSARLLAMDFAHACAGDELAPLGWTQGDYALRQRTQWERGGNVRYTEFWRAELAGAKPIDVDAISTPVPGRDRSLHEVLFSVTRSRTLTVAARTWRLPPSGLLLGSVARAFQSLTGQDDIVMHSTVVDRSQRAMETIGCMMNPIFIRLRNLETPSSAAHATASALLRGMANQSGSGLIRPVSGGASGVSLARVHVEFDSYGETSSASADAADLGAPVPDYTYDRGDSGRPGLSDIEIRFIGFPIVNCSLRFRPAIWSERAILLLRDAVRAEVEECISAALADAKDPTS